MRLEFQEADRSYNPIIEPNFDNNALNEFLTDNFKIPNNNLSEITSFIDKDNELKKIIFELPDLIKKEFPQDEIQIRFYDEFKEDELILEVGILSSFDEKTSFEKEKILENRLYDKYNWNSADKLLIIMEYKNG